MTSGKIHRSCLLVGAIAAVLGAAAAQAQELSEIVVTATKREQGAQDVPISIAAVGAESLAANRIDNVYNLQAVVPGLQVQAVDPPGQGTAFALRGLGNSVFNMGFDPAVATFVDGVYRSRSGLVASTDFVDLERVEVLKGPQGTLFGKNTTAGVVHLISKKPTFDGVNGMIEAGYEDYSRVRLKGTINLPASDTLAFRLSGSYANGDGWMKLINSSRELHDLNRWSLKGQMLFKPNDDVSFHLVADYSKLEENCCWAMRLVNDPRTGSVNGPIAGAAGSGIVDPPDLDGKTAESNFGPDFEAKDYGVMGELNWNLGGATLTSITALRKYKDTAAKDNDFSGVDILRSNQNLPKVKLFSEELRLAGSTDRFNWLVGAFFSKETIEVTNEFIWGSQVNQLQIFGPLLGPGRAFLHEFEQDVKSYAAFANVDFKVTDRFTLSAGFRYSEDKKDGSMVSNHPPGAVLPFASLPLAVVYDYDVSRKDSEPTWTVNAKFDFTDDVMGFVTYSRGYKSGGISMTRDAAGSALFFGSPFTGCPPGSVPVGGPLCGGSPQDPTFKPEKADHYEAGIKSDLLGKRLRVNASVWYTDFKNLQYQTLRAADGAFAVVNIAGAKSKGGELELTLAATERLTLNASLQYLDTSFDGSVPALTPGNPALGGQRLPFSSKLSGNVGFNFEQPISGDWRLLASGNLFFRGKYFNFTEPAPGLVQKGYELLNLRLGVANDNLEFAAWCRNCTDKMYTWSNFAIPFDGALLGHGTRWAHPAEPRMWGVTASYRF
jgi:iron complex outermembrane receptor protein